MITNDIFRKIIRYLAMLLFVWIGLMCISNGLTTIDIITILFFVMSCFIFLDMYYPIVCYP